MNNTYLSIIIPCYNEKKTIIKIVNQIKNLKRIKKQIILIDDGSNDGTRQLIKKKLLNKVNKIIKKINTNHKFGFTGTLPDNDADLWNIFGKIGPTIYQKGSYELRLEKYVSNALVQIVKLHYKNKPRYSSELNDPGERYRQEFDFLFTNTFRNRIPSL